MKYIKTYESYASLEEYLELWKDVIDKKYLLYWDIYFNEYRIIEIDYNKLDYIKNNFESFKDINRQGSGNDRRKWMITKGLPISPLYTYRDGRLIRNHKSKAKFFMVRPKDKNNILYRSDDLNDVKSNLSIFIEMKKFNV